MLSKEYRFKTYTPYSFLFFFKEILTMEKTDIGTHVKEIVKNKKSIPGEINLLLLEPCIQCGSDDPTITITYSDTSLVKANISVTCNNCGRSIKLHGVTFCDIRKEWNIITEKNILKASGNFHKTRRGQGKRGDLRNV